MIPFLFNLSKFVHIVAAMVWVGGVLALIVINSRMTATHNGPAIGVLAQQAEFYGQRVLGPAAGITLLAGISTAVLMRVPFNTLWILWGFAGIFGSMLIGAVFIRRATVKIQQATGGQTPIPQTGAGPNAAAAVQRRLAMLNVINLLLLLSTVMAMVFKPGM